MFYCSVSAVQYNNITQRKSLYWKLTSSRHVPVAVFEVLCFKEKYMCLFYLNNVNHDADVYMYYTYIYMENDFVCAVDL